MSDSTPIPTLSAASARRWDLWALVILLIATLPWWLAATCPFIYLDDPVYIAENPHVLAGLTPQSIVWAFTTTHAGFWFPLTWLSLMLDASIFGKGPLGFHISNIILHLINAWLVYLILSRATKAPIRSLLVAVVFAIHPLRVESVAWATERKDVLTVCFGLLTIWSYLQYAYQPRLWRYLVVFTLYALTLLSKSMLVTLPFLLLLLDVWPLDRFRGVTLRRIILEKIPLLILAIAVGVVTWSIQQDTNTRVYEALRPLLFRLENAFLSYILYLRDTFFFTRSSIFYTYDNEIPTFQWATAAILLLGITLALILAAWNKSKWRPVAVGWLWWLGMLIPMIGIIQSGNQSRADRFTYFPSIGLIIALIWLFPAECFLGEFRKRVTAVLVTLAATTLIFSTILQLLLWRDPLQLYLTSMSPNNYLVAGFIAHEYQIRGDYDKAIEYCELIVRVAPQMHEAENNLGAMLIHTTRYNEALPHLQRAHELAPNNPTYTSNYEKLRNYLQNRTPFPTTSTRP